MPPKVLGMRICPGVKSAARGGPEIQLRDLCVHDGSIFAAIPQSRPQS